MAIHETQVFQKVKHIADNNLPKPIYTFGKRTLELGYELRFLASKNIDEKVFYPLYRTGLVDFNCLYNTKYYLRGESGYYKERTEEFSNALIDKFNPSSAIDFGCGIGHFLKPLHESDVEIKGIDGHSDCKENAVVPSENIEIQDLTEGFNVSKKYDVAICLETLEHIPQEYADKVADIISGSSDTLLISAATPGQGGMHHVNEQPKSYWVKKFEERGFKFCPDLTQEFKSSLDFKGVRKDNLLIFERKGDDK